MANTSGNSGNSDRLYSGGSKITADGDCSHEIKRRLLLGRKAMTNLDSILKRRDITLPTNISLVKAMFFSVVIMHVRVGQWRKLSTEVLMVLKCGVGEDSWESLGLQGDPTSPSWRRSVLGVHWKDWWWSWNSNTLATSCEELTHWKRPWCWERLKEGGEGDGRGWNGWMASPTWLTWIWVSSGSWWWTGMPDVLQSMGSQRIGYEWATELNWHWNIYPGSENEQPHGHKIQPTVDSWTTQVWTAWTHLYTEVFQWLHWKSF